MKIPKAAALFENTSTWEKKKRKIEWKERIKSSHGKHKLKEDKKYKDKREQIGSEKEKNKTTKKQQGKVC